MDASLKKRSIYYGIVLGLATVWVMALAFTQPSVLNNTLTYALPNLEGEILRHDDTRWQGKVVMVNLWGIWCPPCRQEIPHLIDLQERYRDQGFEVVGAEFSAVDLDSFDEHRESLLQFQEGMGINYTLLMAGNPDNIYERFPTLKNMKGFPTSIFIGRDGQVNLITTGFHPDDVAKYESHIEALLAR